MGAHPRPPQRSVSSSSLPVQRPPPQRSLSHQQQFVAAGSPVRKDSSFIDLTADAGDATPNRYHTTPRRGGSRLRLELSHNVSSGSLPTSESPQSLTPSQIPNSDPFQATVGSPAGSTSSTLMPMPTRRPVNSQPRSTPRITATAPAPAKKDARPKPYTVEIPSVAPRYFSVNRPETAVRNPVDPFSKGLNSGYADFFPWNGAHHEDEWSSEAITKGTWDKVNLNVPETSSAKLAIFPALKQKTGLNALSTIFMGVLTQRRHRGQINAPSTFKPPPRVTLTDTKREVWLKDLANPAISLRRLSRTIPHGIRGRTLLDQCLNKNVPAERAVWLAKCVGANEIRGLKRKGVNGAFVMGGELKWARDWTVFVEQFVDAVVSGFGESDWKNRVTYAIRLATNLYSEQLLDRDHYLDWVVSGIENSLQSRIPMWLLIAQIYWKDLLRLRKYGRRLVFALLSHLHVIINDTDQDLLVQLSSKLSALLGSLILTNPESFINPSAWSRYRETLHASLRSDHEPTQRALLTIHSRNSRLVVSSTASPPAGRNQLVKLLDATLKESSDNHLAATCWATSENKPLIMKTVVEWATSFHRPGLAKVYAAARLIRQWSQSRVNPTTPILDTLDNIAVHDKTRKNLVYHLVTELVRTGHFSVSQYMQWTIARGGYHCDAEIDSETGPCSSRLLVELPLHALSEKKRAERGNLLRRAGNYSIADEEQDITNAIRVVKHAVGLPLPQDDPLSGRKPISLKKLLHRISSSSNALRSSIGAHLRDELTGKFVQGYSLSLITFTSVRAIMETAEDFAMLSDILGACTKNADSNVLASVADTVHSNLQIFSALGSANELFNSLIDRLRMMNEEQRIVPRPLLAALSSLAQRMAGYEVIASQLRQELDQNDRNNAIDACSPVSDIVTAPAQQVENNVAEEVEKTLSSGTRLDPPTMNKLFRMIIPPLERGWEKEDDTRRVFATLLARIRVFDAHHFDKLMTDWTSHTRSMSNRSSLSTLFPLLITTGCLTMPIIMSTASPPFPNIQNLPSDFSTKIHSPATYLQELLQLIIMPLPQATGLVAEESYRFHTEQKCAKFEQPKGLLNLIRNALLEYAAVRNHANGTLLPLDDPVCQESLLEALRTLVLVDSSAVSNALGIKSLPAEAVGLVRKVTTKLLIPGDSGETQVSFDHILQIANELTLPFCQLKLNLDLSLPQPNINEAQDQSSFRFQIFARAMDRAIEAGNIMWTSLLPCLSDDITQHLKTQAQTGFLDLIPSSKAPEFVDTGSRQSLRMAENFLEVVEAIISGQAPPKVAQLSLSMVEKLTDLWEIVAAGPQERPNCHAAVLQHWLPAMLRFVTLHSLSSEPPSAPLPTASSTRPPIPPVHDVRARIILVLCGLLLELETLPPKLVGSLAQQVLDIAILLVDALPEELRANCAKAILLIPGGMPNQGTSSDPRLYYLFSLPPPSMSDNLMLSHREKAATPQSAAARGMGAQYGIGPIVQERLSPFILRRWEVLSEPTPNVGENDTSLSLGLFEAIKLQ
ncbi:srb8-DNA directed rna polymerase ii holoenzyme and srb10 cdk subcomplex subunit [Fusarium beomiforme]|uniref:Mediator of RNA polymerase II transcription subunit 12 n=1 Tax=Fusarium beomiforme TaxID=44412 RepID=A0A9P5AJM9_9HYPO|nr:srb8-DNA directed rna polymerase ii holoenzyme and srb10 cdk subcomplex subunit [Fusarium beomiforme]